MDVAMNDATPSEPIPSRTPLHISDLSTLTIDRSNVSPSVVPCGEHHSLSLFKLVLLTYFSIGVMCNSFLRHSGRRFYALAELEEHRQHCP